LWGWGGGFRGRGMVGKVGSVLKEAKQKKQTLGTLGKGQIKGDKRTKQTWTQLKYRINTHVRGKKGGKEAYLWVEEGSDQPIKKALQDINRGWREKGGFRDQAEFKTSNVNW